MSTSDDPESTPDRDAPEGSACSAHPEIPAVATCPRCGNHACMVCWHASVDRCDTCLKRDPSEAAPPLPWEQPALSFPARLLGTLATALTPVKSAPAFGRDELQPALSFALITFAPLALLAGVIPYTKTMEFSGPFVIKLQGTPLPDHAAIVTDVVRASLIGFALCLLQWAVFTAPYVSLARAYGDPRRRNVALRTMLYRGFLIPAQQVIFMLLAWAFVARGAPEAQVAFLMLVSLIPLVLLMSTMWSAARLGVALGPLMSFVVVAVPITLWQYMQPALLKLLTYLKIVAP